MEDNPFIFEHHEPTKTVLFVTEDERFTAATTEEHLRALWVEYRGTETAKEQITFMHFVQLAGVHAWKAPPGPAKHVVDACLN